MNGSSTSSFDERRFGGGFPWAFVLALALLGLVELGIRRADPERVIPYALGVTEYRAAACYLDAFGPADVCFVGSSRTRESVILPTLRDRCERALARRVTTANYSCGAARSRDSGQVVSYILKRGRPEIILYGVAPRQLFRSIASRERLAVFWDFADWREQFRQRPDEAQRLLPIVIRNHVGNFYRTLKYRLTPRSWIKNRLNTLALRHGATPTINAFLETTPSPCPLRGESSRWHLLRDRRLSVRSVPDARVRRFIDDQVGTPPFTFDAEQTDQLFATMHRCKEAGVTLVLFELPLPQVFRRHLPPKLLERFRNLIKMLAEAENTTFVTLEELGLVFTDADFAEEVHMHRDGAVRLTQALADHVIVPQLRTSEPTYAGTLP